MTAVLSGTNGLIQAYDYQTPTTGFSYTFAAGTQVLVMNPAGTLATGTITMPASPADGMTITFSSSQQITALTLSGNTGQSIVSNVTFLPAKTGVSYVYRLANTTWYPTVTVPNAGSQLVSGTAITLTTQTNVDFTAIPSWVKRVTIGLNAVSLNSATPDFYLQLGYGATPTFETTNYIANSAQINSAGSTGFNGNITTAFLFSRALSLVADTISGIIVLTNVSGNIWAMMGNTSRNVSQAVTYAAGVKTISGGALSAVRITTSSGTDQFDAGSINILYE
jgi:hypothetical protein